MSFRHQLAHEWFDGKALFLVAVQGRKVAIRIVVAQIVVPLASDAPDAIDRFVNAVASRECVLPFRAQSVAQKHSSLHPQRTTDPGESECGWRHINEADDLVAYAFPVE